MKTILLSSLSCLLLFSISNLHADETVQSAELGKTVHVIGRLGKELGTVVTVMGVASKTQTQADKGILVFEIVQVNDTTLDQPMVLGLQFPPSSKLPDTNGNVVAKFRGYETGSFIGVPAEARTGSEDPKAPLEWKFHTHFKVVTK